MSGLSQKVQTNVFNQSLVYVYDQSWPDAGDLV